MNDLQVKTVQELRELVHAVSESVGSGQLGFDYALKEYVEHCDSALAQSFQVYITQMGLGGETQREIPTGMEAQVETTRRNILRQIAQSVRVPEVTEFIEALIRSQDEKISLIRTLQEVEKHLKD